MPAICSHDGYFVIAASGPSLPSYVEELRKEQEVGRPICAINGAHNFLVDNGITPNLFLSTDPRETIIPNIGKPQDDTIYLLASRCHPGVFDHLKDKKVLIWHAWSDEEECSVWQEQRKLGIAGGTTSGLRAINVAYILGFRKFILYGMDSCLDEDKDTKRFSGEKVGKGWVTDVIVGGKLFWCNGAMAQQATEFQMLYNYMPGLSIQSKGNGLISEIIYQRKLRGLIA